ncbi:uncharacterized protein LOC128312031 [Acinonyx jubatus]|uniref:Uncharacterized protein LOC128312031 n=1 Tax=Acinonyx jubatus TaxID=32536 RepID=A0ABM3NLI8_ACIJB|nr:uncharacterized protein LOC128312031 [Acinonyx jubatus]
MSGQMPRAPNTGLSSSSWQGTVSEGHSRGPRDLLPRRGRLLPLAGGKAGASASEPAVAAHPPADPVHPSRPNQPQLLPGSATHLCSMALCAFARGARDPAWGVTSWPPPATYARPFLQSPLRQGRLQFPLGLQQLQRSRHRNGARPASQSKQRDAELPEYEPTTGKPLIRRQADRHPDAHLHPGDEHGACGRLENATRHQDKTHSPEEAPSRAHREGYRERPEDKRGLPRKSQSPVCAWNLLPGAPLLPPPRGKQPSCSSTHESPDSTWSDRTMADHRATKRDASDTCYDTGAPLRDASSADEDVTRGDRTGHRRPTPYVGPHSRRAFQTEKATHDKWICGHRGRGPGWER